MARLYQRVGRMLERREISRPGTATIYEINGDRVDIRIGNSSNIIHYVPVVGDISTLHVGDTVNIQWVEMEGSSGYRPVVMALASQSGGSIQTSSEVYPDNLTI